MTDRKPLQPGELIGAWRKIGTPACAQKYPDTISFGEGAYRGARGAAQGMIWWDAGIYRVEKGSTLVVATATDELVHYQVELHGNRLDITDPEGCHFSYQRQPPDSP